MGGKQSYLCKKLMDGEIQHLDPIESQQRLTLLNQAPDIFLRAIKAGLMSYPAATTKAISLDDPSRYVDKYDCIRAYNLRQEGMTYRQIAKMIGCGMNRVFHILNHGEDLLLQNKISKIKDSVTNKPEIKSQAKQSKTPAKRK